MRKHLPIYLHTHISQKNIFIRTYPHTRTMHGGDLLRRENVRIAEPLFLEAVQQCRGDATCIDIIALHNKNLFQG